MAHECDLHMGAVGRETRPCFTSEEMPVLPLPSLRVPCREEAPSHRGCGGVFGPRCWPCSERQGRGLGTPASSGVGAGVTAVVAGGVCVRADGRCGSGAERGRRMRHP